MAHDDDAGNDVPLAVPVRGATAQAPAHAHAADVLHEHGRSARVRAHRHGFEIGDLAEVAATAHEVFALAHLDEPAAHVAARAPHRVRHVRERQPVGSQALRVERDLVFGLEPADRRDFGDAGNARERVADREVVERAKLTGVALAGGVDERVLKDPADAARVRSEPRRRAFRQARLNRVQVLENARASPIRVRALFEHDVDEAHAEHALPAHFLDFRRAEQRGDERIRHLVFDERR